MAPQTTTTTSTPTDDPLVIIKRRGSMKVMRIDVPLAGFRAEDVIVRPDDCRLLILRSVGSDEGKNATEDVTIRTIPVPECVDPYAMEAVMNDGILTIEAPMAF